MAEKSSGGSAGIRSTGLLGVLFVGLKLTHYIDWSWWYVTLPFWGGSALVLAVCAVLLAGAGVCFGIAGVVEAFQPKKSLPSRRFR